YCILVQKFLRLFPALGCCILPVRSERRIQSVYDYRELLNAAPSVVAKAAEIQATEQRSNLPEEKKHESPAKAEKAKKKGNKGKLIA
ncbi:hypothetical protein OSL55_27445, partial [Escherichia coli]|nr:hypothetical protein [Escherichia coli]